MTVSNNARLREMDAEELISEYKRLGDIDFVYSIEEDALLTKQLELIQRLYKQLTGKEIKLS